MKKSHILVKSTDFFFIHFAQTKNSTLFINKPLDLWYQSYLLQKWCETKYTLDLLRDMRFERNKLFTKRSEIKKKKLALSNSNSDVCLLTRKKLACSAAIFSTSEWQ